MIKRSIGEHVFDTINVLILLGVAIVTLYPFWYVIIASISNPLMVAAGKVFLWPIGFELASYEKAFSIEYFWTSYGNTVFISVCGTIVNMVFTILTAYPLAKSRLPGKKFFTLYMIFTMWFGAGMMPYYLNLKNLGLLNSRFTLIITGAISPFYVILMRSYFESISDSLEESAKMDGANDWLVLFKIYIPLSVPCLMTLTLYYFVERWNSYFWAMVIMKDQWKLPLQVLLQKLVVQTQAKAEMQDVSTNVTNQQTIIYSTIVVATLPMLILYPFVQKFFVKGIMIGAVKG